MTKFERITKVRLPFDRKHTEDGKNYGIGGLDIWFVLKGPKGAVQFAVMFPVYLPHVAEELKRSSFASRDRIRGFDVGYHAMTPQYDNQPEMDCEFTDTGKCFYDGSSLRSDAWVDEIFSIRGEHPDKRMWEMLEQEYHERFGE